MAEHGPHCNTCTCGFGGEDSDRNPRRDLNREDVTPSGTDPLTIAATWADSPEARLRKLAGQVQELFADDTRR